MKIMINITGLRKGGAERVVSVLANKLVDKYEIVILVHSSNKIEYDIDKRVKIMELANKRQKSLIIRNLQRIMNTKKIIKKENPDIIVSFLPMPSYRVLFFKNKKNNIPIIVADRNDPKEEYKSLLDKILMKLLYKKADGFVFQTNEQRDFFKKNIRNKSTIIYNPIKDEFIQKTKENSIKKEKVIISVGRLTSQKNQKILINAFSKIVKLYPEYKLKIFGQGDLEKTLKEQIISLNLENKVLLCGVSNNIKNELEKSEIFVLPSDYEGMPNALIEAMAIGLPVISTDCPCGGPRELIQNNVNGILIPVDDTDSLEQKIKMLIEDKKMALKIGKEASKIKEKLNSDKIVAQWEDYINFILLKKEKNNEKK